MRERLEGLIGPVAQRMLGVNVPFPHARASSGVTASR